MSIVENPKKKILLINNHFGVGGIETSLVNMANALCDDYDVDLLIYYPEGVIKERLNPDVRILETSLFLKAMAMNFNEALRSKNPLIILFKVFGSVWTNVFDNRFPIWIATKVQRKHKGYDLAIAYRQEPKNKHFMSGFVRVLNRCVDAKIKAAWIHIDATKYPDYIEFNKRYYRDVDKIIGVSKSVAEAYKSVNPDFADKVDYCYNFMNYDTIIEKSLEEQSVEYPNDKFICFSACRLEEKQKRVVRAVKAIAPVLREHNDVIWYIAGDGPDRTSVENAIAQEGMQDRIILLGNLSNPYPYMKNSDLVMLLSYHEAAPMVYMEAKALHVPVFSTKVLSTDEMLKDGIEDFICENSEEGIREKFRQIIENRAMVANAKEALETYISDNHLSLEKINGILNG